MDKYLNLRRLALVMEKFWFENRRALFLLLLAIASFLTIWLGIYLSFRNPGLFQEKFQVAHYFVGLLLSGCLSANFLFSDLGTRPKAINYLLLPASSLEKMVCALFFGVVVFWIGYTLAFYIVDSSMVTMANKLYGTHWTVINVFSMSGQYVDPFFEKSPNNLFFMYFTCQAIFITGSLYFSKYTFFKTVIASLFIWIILISVPAGINSVLPTGVFNERITVFEVLDYRGSKLVEMPGWFNASLSIFSFYIITPELWLIAYFRLREKEVP